MHSGFKLIDHARDDFTHTLALKFGEFSVSVVSNSQPLLDGLSTYFSRYVVANVESSVTVHLFETDKINIDLEWKDWPREAGKTGKKEQICDVEDGRFVHKFKTGMVFFQHLSAPLAIGPCSDHQSQIINFIINQHINYLQQQGGLICHAACLQIDATGIAIGAYSGGGKSTTMLKLMELPHSKFVSNDRLFIFDEQDGIRAAGVAKQPRVNPGTLLFNPRLKCILSDERIKALEQMPSNELWQLEEKYDVMVSEHYDVKGDVEGPSSIADIPLQHVVLLNWKPGHSDEAQLSEIQINDRTELVAAIAKSPGPFYQEASGAFLKSADIPEAQYYLDKLNKVKVWEATGGADFDALIALIKKHLL